MRVWVRQRISNKVYTHSYDEYVGGCVKPPKRSILSRKFLMTYSWAFKWLKQRIADELTMHVLHAFGILTWRT